MRKSRATGAGCGAVFNLLAVLLLLLTCLSGVVYAALFVNPQLNPIEQFRPTVDTGADLVEVATLIPTLAGNNATATQRANGVPTLPPQWTATKTPTVTNTAPATSTATRTATATPVPPTRTLTPTPTKTATATPTGPTPTPSTTRSPFQFTLQSGSPAYVANIENTNGCSWFGISGQVFDLQNKGIVGVFLHFEGGGVSFDAVTGSAPKYGSSGYVINIGNTPVASTTTYKLQLRNGAGQPLSDTYLIPTFQDCGKNQILVNFVQNH